jgi:hypothetical protein
MSAFEEMGNSARVVGMGEAFTALSDDVSALNNNPAGLMLLKGAEFIGVYSDKAGLDFGSISDVFLAVAKPLSPNFSVGLAGYMLSTEFGSEISTKQYYFNLGVATKIRSLLFGGNLRNYSNDQQTDEIPHATDLDFGFILPIYKTIKVGYAVQNILHGDLGTNNGHDYLPTKHKVGLTFNHKTSFIDWNFTADMYREMYKEEIKPLTLLQLGSEFWLINRLLALRIGYIKEISDKLSVSPIEKLTAGIGASWKNIQIDYARAEDIGESKLADSKVSVIWRFIPKQSNAKQLPENVE